MFWQDKALHLAAEKLYVTLMRQVRLPVFYTDLQVPDTADGRFDVMALHAFLVLERLHETGQEALAQALINRIFADFEDVLREAGNGDGTTLRTIKLLAGAFYGRLQGYEGAGDSNGWRDVIGRNLYRGNGDMPVARLVRYVRSARKGLALWLPQADVLDFGAVPA